MVKVRKVCYGLCILVTMLLFTVGLLLLGATIRALTIEDIDYQDAEFKVGDLEELPDSYLEGIPELYAEALKIPTIATGPGQYDTEQLLLFHQFLRDSFPDVFNSSFIQVEIINNYSFLFTINGSDENVQPYLLAAHMDVVPVIESEWSHPPFGGEIAPDPDTGEMSVWGRGAIDDKIGVMGILTSLQYLATSGFKPRRTFYVAFGHDEEVTGTDGASHIGKELQQRGVILDFLLDEGIPVLDDAMQGVDTPVAMIGVTEKGIMMLKLEVEGEGGHSSMPPKKQVIPQLSRAISNLENYPQPNMFGTGPEAAMFDFLAPKALWPYKLLFANLWLFKPLLAMVMSRSRETNAFTRTTTAITMINGGIKENVVASSVYAIVNHRVHPSQSLEDVLQHDINVINDPGVKVSVMWQRHPHPVSPYGPDVPGWRLLASNTKHFFPDAVSIPGMMIANTDTVFYLNLTSCIYRYNPIRIGKRHLALIHGHDERISVDSVRKAVRFYHRLILSADVDVAPLKTTQPGHRSGEF